VLEFNTFVTEYGPAVLALLFVLAYYSFATLLLHLPGPAGILVPRYEPPPGASPAVAAWLFEPGKLPRAMAAAFVNMAAKGYLKIEQKGDLYSLTQLESGPSVELEPEEDALARKLLESYGWFDFDEATPQLSEAIRAFRQALKNTRYFSEHILLFMPAWIVSGLGMLFVFFHGHYSRHFTKVDSRFVAADILVTLGCLIVAVRTLPGPLEKIASRFPSSTAPQRPWTSADSRSLTFLLATLGGLIVLVWLTTDAVALFAGAFMILNAGFYHALQGPTSVGRKISAQLAEYRSFLSEVEADPISRTNSPDDTPRELNQKNAYALAFHLDLGWGEQFVTSIADVIECADVLRSNRPHHDPAY
jgi:hypothetical protein